jgi:hypothetical protein
VVLRTVELRAPHPVLQRQLARVLDAHPPLLGAVDEEQPAEAPERLPAERLLRLLLEQHDAPAGVGDLGGGGQTGQAGTHDEDICRFHEARSLHVPWSGPVGSV